MLATNFTRPAGNGFLFYDIETTGLAKGFDQITQIALVRTDEDLIIADPARDVINLRGRRLPWVVPSPGAMLVTGVSPDELEQAAFSHYEMMRLVAGALEDAAPAVFIGYNSLSFDEEHLRTNLFATLHPAYLTSQPGCGRADAYQMLKVVRALAPGAIRLGEIDGRASMKLGEVLRANGIPFAAEMAHDALADVMGTIALVKLMQERCPAIIGHMLTMASRNAAGCFLAENPIFAYATCFGEPYVSSSRYVATHPTNTNQIAVFDLAHDPSPYLAMSVEELAEALWAKPRVLRAVKLNAQPAMLPLSFVPAGQRAVDDYTIEARAVSIGLAHDFQSKVAAAMQLSSDLYPRSLHVEQQLYDGFPSWADKRLAARFHETPDWRERARMTTAFADARLRYHALRLVYAERPNALPQILRDDLDAWLRERLLGHDEDLPFMTLHAACAEIESLAMLDGATGGNPDPAGSGRTIAERLDEIEAYYLMLASGHR